MGDDHTYLIVGEFLMDLKDCFSSFGLINWSIEVIYLDEFVLSKQYNILIG